MRIEIMRPQTRILEFGIVFVLVLLVASAATFGTHGWINRTPLSTPRPNEHVIDPPMPGDPVDPCSTTPNLPSYCSPPDIPWPDPPFPPP